MKIVAGLIAVLFLASFVPVKAQTPARASAHIGRYQIVHTYQNRALMLDTETGAVWELTYGDFCAGKAGFCSVDYSSACKEGESSFSHISSFQRVSVEGLYATPLQSFINRAFLIQAEKSSPPKVSVGGTGEAQQDTETASQNSQ